MLRFLNRKQEYSHQKPDSAVTFQKQHRAARDLCF